MAPVSSVSHFNLHAHRKTPVGARRTRIYVPLMPPPTPSHTPQTRTCSHLFIFNLVKCAFDLHARTRTHTRVCSTRRRSRSVVAESGRWWWWWCRPLDDDVRVDVTPAGPGQSIAVLARVGHACPGAKHAIKSSYL